MARTNLRCTPDIPCPDVWHLIRIGSMLEEWALSFFNFAVTCVFSVDDSFFSTTTERGDSRP